MTHPNPGRDDRIDALRGLALLGILLVNIQSFVWGGTSPAGYLQGDETALDRALFFLTVAFVNTKFMPLFAMLFGAGFALLLARLRSVTSAPHAVFRRRMRFLFAFGILHGVLLYFGDITQMYALAGLVLLLYDGHGPAALRRAVVLWWGGALALTALLTWGVAGSLPDPVELASELEANFAVFTGEGYFEQLPTRVSLFVDIALANLIGLPMAVALMLTGMLAQRAGWLADRAAPAWRIALVIGLGVGLPSALVYGVLLYTDARDVRARRVLRRGGDTGSARRDAVVRLRRALLPARVAGAACAGSRRPGACRSRTTCCSPLPWEPCCPAGAWRWRPASGTRKPRRWRWRSSPRSSR